MPIGRIIREKNFLVAEITFFTTSVGMLAKTPQLCENRRERWLFVKAQDGFHLQDDN